MGIDHVDRMFGHKPTENEGDRFLRAVETGHPVCHECWGLGFVPGPNGRHTVCDTCGYDMVEF